MIFLQLKMFFRNFSDNFPGLKWMNDDKTIFRIPWKHAGKFSWREEDCLIFKVKFQKKKNPKSKFPTKIFFTTGKKCGTKKCGVLQRSFQTSFLRKNIIRCLFNNFVDCFYKMS